MDALTWFKFVSERGRATPAPLRADVGTAPRADVPLHLAAARLRPPVASAEDDEDWDAAIARAKMQAALPRAASPPPPTRPRDASPELQATPPPSPAPRAGAAQDVRAKLDRFWGGPKKPAAPPTASRGLRR